ncbi:MAG: hypothetical protein WAK93_20285 [Solirubrobacteraceae bacterium]
MRRWLIAACLLAAFLVTAPAALANTQTATAGNVTATFTYTGHVPNFKNERLSIAQAGAVDYNLPVTSAFCGKGCWPLSTLVNRPSVHVLNLEGNGQPDVVLDLYSGGAHCCTVEQIFSFDPGTMTYVKTERDFYDAGVKFSDLAHNGREELVTADELFAYEFTDFADSALPIQIFSFSGRRFTNVTRSYPKLIAKDAARWLKAYKARNRRRYQTGVGVIAAWAADEDLLGKEKLVSRYLNQQARAGRLTNPQGAGGKRFVAKLQNFLRKHGYRS